MACNYCFPTRTIFQINSEFRKKGTFRRENRTSCLVGLKTHPTIVPRSGIELTTSRLHSVSVAKVSHALNHSAMDILFHYCLKESHVRQLLIKNKILPDSWGTGRTRARTSSAVTVATACPRPLCRHVTPSGWSLSTGTHAAQSASERDSLPVSELDLNGFWSIFINSYQIFLVFFFAFIYIYLLSNFCLY